jgi:hypothetical protein
LATVHITISEFHRVTRVHCSRPDSHPRPLLLTAVKKKALRAFLAVVSACPVSGFFVEAGSAVSRDPESLTKILVRAFKRSAGGRSGMEIRGRTARGETVEKFRAELRRRALRKSPAARGIGCSAGGGSRRRIS